MSISHDNNTYQSEVKQQWREFIYSLATADTCASLVDSDGKYQHKWLELVGDNALTFNQLLSTGRIGEHQLIGIDNREDNIVQCKPLFPLAEFYAQDWNAFCRTYPRNDIGIIVFDSWNAAYGNDFKTSLSATMNLAVRCKQAIGECLVVINVDGSKTHRGYALKRGMTSREVLKHNIENVFKYSDIHALTTLNISVDSMYEYKQHAMATTMLTCGILL